MEDWIHDKALGILNSVVYRNRPDYRSEKLKLIIEFDGIHHYMKPDIIEKDFLNHLLGKNFINVLSREEKEGFEYGHITKELIKSQMENPNTYVYLCGPKVMMNAILVQLKELGVEESKIIKERF